jgi:mannitol/fructose-specific phosphotransferase system IIA component
MRFIGNKENLVKRIYEIFKSKGIVGKSFFDFFQERQALVNSLKNKDFLFILRI